ncbi:maltodextrin glucosidase [Anaerolineales bacterium]
MSSIPLWAKTIHHDGSNYYLSNPWPAIGEEIQVRLTTPADVGILSVFLRARPDGEFQRIEMQKIEEDEQIITWECSIRFKQEKNHYRFKLITSKGAFYYTANGLYRSDVPDWYDFKILADYQAPHWVRESVFYQIFPERFANGDPDNDVQDGEYSSFGKKTIKRKWGELPYRWEEAGCMDFFGGDLEGITQNLDHLERLGVNAIYLTPIFTAPSNHKYDIIDFHQVDPHFGGNEAFIRLREETEKRNIKLMLDITPNHIGHEHPWFFTAREDPDSDEAHFFIRDLDGFYEYWLGVSSLVKLNYTSQVLRDRMYRDPDSAIRFWLQEPYSIDAWRLDVANMTANSGLHQQASEVWQELSQAARLDKEDVYLIGEYFQDGTPHLQGDQLDATMNYQGFNTPVRRWLGGEDMGVADNKPYGDIRPLDTEALAEQWENYLTAIPYVIALQQFNQISSHDIKRILSVVKMDIELAKLGLGLLMSFPGTPCVYYGDEIGIEGGKDPDNRRCMNWDEEHWNQDLFQFYQKLISLRRECPALIEGGFQMLYAKEESLAFRRMSKDQSLIIVAHRGMESTSITIENATLGLKKGDQLKDLISGNLYSVDHDGLQVEHLSHGQVLILEKQSRQ